MKDFPLSAKVYILTNVVAGFGLLATYLPDINLSDVWMLLVLCALASLSLIFKVIGATEGTHYNIAFLVYSFAFFQLGAPAAMLVALVSNLLEWVWHKYPWYIQTFNIGQYIIALTVMNLVYHTLNPDYVLAGWMDIIAAIAGMIAFTLVNHFLVGMVLWFVRQESLAKSGVMKLFPLILDFSFWALGAGAALVWLIEPLATVLVLIPLYLMYSTLKVPALERKTEVDPKTGLFNAEYFANNLESELSRANRFDRPIVIVMADLDLLRNINNTYGHLAGDEVLIGVANIIKENVREYDIVSRFGGEEYAILMPETTPEEAFPRIETIRKKIADYEFTIPTSITPISASMSFGIAGRDRQDQAANEIIHNADLALYHAKAEGRNCTFIYSEEGFKELFQSGRHVPTSQAIPLEERIHKGSFQFKPSPLRGEPVLDASEREPDPQQKATRKKQEVNQEKSQPVPAPSPTTAKFHPAWYAPTYTGVIALLAITLSIHTTLHFGTPSTTPEWIGLLSFGVLVFLSELFSVDIYLRNTSISTSAAPLIGGTLLFGPAGSLIFSVLVALGAMIKHRSPVKRMIFNASNQALAGNLFLFGLNHAGYSFLELGYPSQLLATIFLAIIVYMVTTTLISLGIDLERGIPYSRTWKENFSWLSPYYLAMGTIAFALTLSYQLIGFIGLVVIIIPLLVLRYSQGMYIQRTKESVTHLLKTNQELEATSSEITKLNNELLQVLSYVIDMRDPFILGHSHQVVFYAVRIAQKLGLSKERIEIIRKGALIHDIGKLGIPESILGKQSKLTPEEYQIVRRHVNIGAEIISQSDALKNMVPMIYHHHEHFDGNGYPDGLKGHEIPLEARILALADSIEAMASDRPYRRGISFENILVEVEKNRGTHFDPQIVDAFFEIVEEMEEPFVINSADYVTMARDFSMETGE